MARFKHCDTSPQFMVMDLHAQLIPDTFAFVHETISWHKVSTRKLRSPRAFEK